MTIFHSRLTHLLPLLLRPGLGVGAVALLILGAIALPARAAETFLIKDSQPQAQIVIAEKPARIARIAAAELQEYLEKISGAKLPITSTPDEKIPVKIFVGKSSFTDDLKLSTEGIAHGAFRQASGKDWVALLGPDQDFTPIEPWARSRGDIPRVLKEWDAITGSTWGNPYQVIHPRYNKTLDVWDYDDRGTLNAVHEYLRSLGVRWYFPGPLGEFVPAQKTIALPTFNKIVKPDFALRRLSFYFDTQPMNDDEVKWLLRQGLNVGPEIVGLMLPCHGSKFVYTRDEMKKAHPEYYALWRGKRATDHRECGAPCLSSEGLYNEHLKFSQKIFDHYREPMVSLDVCDGYGASLCACPLCEGKGSPDRGWQGQMSDYVWGYVDRMARDLHKSHPDRKVSGLAYSAYTLPPEKIDVLSPNIALWICQTRSTFTNSDTFQQAQDLRQQWLKKLPSKELYIWDYYLQNRPGNPYEGLPVYLTQLIARDLKSLKGVAQGQLIEVYRDRDPSTAKIDFWAVQHLNMYVTARLWWDADQNVDALMEEYYRHLYGPVAAQMKAYVEFCEANWPRMTSQVEPVDQAMKMLAAARQAAGDTIYGQRIDRLVGYTAPMALLRDRLSKGRENIPDFRALPRDVAKLQLDGKIEGDPFWEGVRSDVLRDIKTAAWSKNSTKFWIAWGSDNALYIALRCDDVDSKNLMITTTKNDDTNLWQGDNVELFIETQVNSFYQIGINPAGAVLDLDRSGGKLETLWSSNAKVATFIGDGFWSAEIRLPIAGESAKDLDARNGIAGRKPSDTYPWYMNIGRHRIRGDQVELTSWSPVPSGKFNVVDRFGKVWVK